MTNKTGYAKYTFAFASDLQALADSKRIRITHFEVKEKKNNRGSYDFLQVTFVVPRPDRDEQKTKTFSIEEVISQLENQSEQKEEESTDEI